MANLRLFSFLLLFVSSFTIAQEAARPRDRRAEGGAVTNTEFVDCYYSAIRVTTQLAEMVGFKPPKKFEDDIKETLYEAGGTDPRMLVSPKLKWERKGDKFESSVESFILFSEKQHYVVPKDAKDFYVMINGAKRYFTVDGGKVKSSAEKTGAKLVDVSTEPNAQALAFMEFPFRSNLIERTEANPPLPQTKEFRDFFYRVERRGSSQFEVLRNNFTDDEKKKIREYAAELKGALAKCKADLAPVTYGFYMLDSAIQAVLRPVADGGGGVGLPEKGDHK